MRLPLDVFEQLVPSSKEKKWQIINVLEVILEMCTGKYFEIKEQHNKLR